MDDLSSLIAPPDLRGSSARWQRADEPAPADRLWCEHGWGLGGRVVAGVIALVLLATGAAHLLG